MAGLKFSGPAIIESPVEVEETKVQPEREWIVTVFDNEVNTYDEVIAILILATGCTYEEASIETWEIDHLGKSVVHCSSEEECKKVASVIAKIGIYVEVSQEFSS